MCHVTIRDFLFNEEIWFPNVVEVHVRISEYYENK